MPISIKTGSIANSALLRLLALLRIGMLLVSGRGLEAGEPEGERANAGADGRTKEGACKCRGEQAKAGERQ